MRKENDMDESAKDTFRQAPDAPEGDRISTDGMGAGSPGDAPVSGLEREQKWGR